MALVDTALASSVLQGAEQFAGDVSQFNTGVHPDSYGPDQWKAWSNSYMQQIEQYKNTPYYEQLKNNPYLAYQEAPLNFFDRLWRNMTGKSAKETDFQNQRMQSAQEYYAQVMDAMRQEEYNSPQAQMARMKAAGINPELSGGEGISSGETGTASPDDTPPAAVPTEDAAAAGQIMSLGFGLFQNAISAIAGIQNIYGASLANSQREMALTDQGWDQLIKLAAESSDLNLGGKTIQELSSDDIDRITSDSVHGLIDRLGRGEFSNMYDRKVTRKMMKRLESILGDGGTNSLAYKKYRSELMKEISGNTESAAETMGKFGFSDNILKYGQQIADTFSNIEKEARLAAGRLTSSASRQAGAEADYAEAYYSTELGAAEGEAALEDARMRKAQAKLDSYIDTQLDGLLDSLKAKGDTGSLILTFLIASMRSVVKQAGASMLGNAGALLKKPSAGITINTQ